MVLRFGSCKLLVSGRITGDCGVVVRVSRPELPALESRSTKQTQVARLLAATKLPASQILLVAWKNDRFQKIDVGRNRQHGDRGVGDGFDTHHRFVVAS